MIRPATNCGQVGGLPLEAGPARPTLDVGEPGIVEALVPVADEQVAVQHAGDIEMDTGIREPAVRVAADAVAVEGLVVLALTPAEPHERLLVGLELVAEPDLGVSFVPVTVLVVDQVAVEGCGAFRAHWRAGGYALANAVHIAEHTGELN